jgi:hypothetical protein
MEFEKLTVHHYDISKENEKRVTLSPNNINLLATNIEDTIINGLSLRKVTVLFLQGDPIDLLVNHADLEKMERAIGSFYLEE